MLAVSGSREIPQESNVGDQHIIQLPPKVARFKSPGILHIAVDPVAQKIVKALEVRQWHCPTIKGLNIEFETFRSPYGKPWEVSKIQADDFCIRFHRTSSQFKGQYFVNVVVIPREKLILTDDKECGRTYSKVVWEKDKTEIMEHNWEKEFEPGGVNCWRVAKWLETNVLAKIETSKVDVPHVGALFFKEPRYPKELGPFYVTVNKDAYDAFFKKKLEPEDSFVTLDSGVFRDDIPTLKTVYPDLQYFNNLRQRRFAYFKRPQLPNAEYTEIERRTNYALIKISPKHARGIFVVNIEAEKGYLNKMVDCDLSLIWKSRIPVEEYKEGKFNKPVLAIENWREFAMDEIEFLDSLEPPAPPTPSPKPPEPQATTSWCPPCPLV